MAYSAAASVGSARESYFPTKKASGTPSISSSGIFGTVDVP